MRSEAYEQRRLRLVAREATGSDILDLGYAAVPNRHLSGKRVVGVDLAPPPPEVPACYAECLVGDATDLPAAIGDRAFDSVIACELIEHLERPYDFLRAARATIRPGGRLVLSTPNPLAPPVLLFEIARSRGRYFTDEHVFYFNPRWMVRALERAGYHVERIRPVGFGHPFFVIPSPVWLSYQLIYVARPSD